ncbi:hypothetical protein [Cupriavidus sp. D384]|uniref:hypothetical protein n=1 Tax=Cupriavidus sp. D384 TaxID=1538095 RepID=UPI000833E6AD|nr:hypothetical protein [Cupriavidus sp. D384]
MIVLLAFLPLQAWAGIGTSTVGPDMVQAPHMAALAQDNVAVAADQADFSATPASSDTSSPADQAEPTPPGADFAEQLLPAPLPRVVTSAARGAVPRYAAAALPDPDLPLLPRPPRG